ncbi:hypothetical protein [Sulfuricella sp.]|uniref:hypothetical protein n=1 Tax=Sulfuricella sp. TaxID=2099377 RepID=UPI002C76782E|nr:hypothetical protein [Sulfuricella sp.]HUX65209.1 hypothetical protein [Sulfuricella sp.]
MISDGSAQEIPEPLLLGDQACRCTAAQRGQRFEVDDRLTQIERSTRDYDDACGRAYV